MKTMLLAASTAALVCYAGAGHANDTTLKPYTEIRVAQFQPGDHLMEKEQATWMDNTIAAACTPQAAAPPAAPLVGAIGGIIIDWLFERGSKAVSKRLQEKIDKYTTTSANKQVYRDMFDPGLWDADESCVLVQRVHCSAPTSDIESGRAHCKADDKAGMTVGLRLKREADLLRVLPYAQEVTSIDPKKPSHDGGDVSIAITFRIDAFGRNTDGSGYPWKSQDVLVASMDCAVRKDKKAREGRDSAGQLVEARNVTGTCKKNHFTGPDWTDAWQYAHVLPKPPPSKQAFVFTMADVGKPSRSLEIFKEFFDATGSDLSGALSEALQNKIKLKDD
ncbi:hypothetical protein [uncultured Luteimonas sp.]|uniref:hypothetical protein n=1 Tax=uncultured Luteimonas sp. TaxID=453144 RepID=UPI00261E2812|nr:hypothetical protein [uncultured Luteimonas sp.]